MIKKLILGLLAVFGLVVAGVSLWLFFPRPQVDAAAYADGAKWLCLPGRDDVCAGDFAATVIAADGTATLEAFAPDADAPFDCFYLYPTVSTDVSPNSDWAVDVQETGVAQIQFARYGEVCRLYAPIYRQVTLPALAVRRLYGVAMGSGALADADVRAAWNYYLTHYNQGRGVVLIGHSQGTRRLQTLIPAAIEGTEVADRIIGVQMIGLNVEVDADTGAGPFADFPACKGAAQIGCTTAYTSFRATAIPKAAPAYGITGSDDTRVLCVNPAAPAAPTGQAAPLDAYFPSRALLAGRTASSRGGITWSTQHPTVDTPFVKLPGLLSGACVRRGVADVFAVSIHSDPNDPRTDDIAGDLVINKKLYPEWGLHLIDMNLALGDLVEMTRAQGTAWLKAQAAR